MQLRTQANAHGIRRTAAKWIAQLARGQQVGARVRSTVRMSETCAVCETTVFDKPLKCTGCTDRPVVYCSRSCQKAHWPEHKAVCGGVSSSTR